MAAFVQADPNTASVQKRPVKPLDFGTDTSHARYTINYMENLDRLPDNYRREAFQALAEGKSIQARVDPRNNNGREVLLPKVDLPQLVQATIQEWLLSAEEKLCIFDSERIDLSSLKQYLEYNSKKLSELDDIHHSLDALPSTRTSSNGDPVNVAQADKKFLSMYTFYGPILHEDYAYCFALFLSVDYDYDEASVKKFKGGGKDLLYTHASFVSVYRKYLSESSRINAERGTFPLYNYDPCFSAQVIKGKLFRSFIDYADGEVRIGDMNVRSLLNVIFLRGEADLKDAMHGLGSGSGGEDEEVATKMVQRLSLIKKLKISLEGLKLQAFQVIDSAPEKYGNRDGLYI